MAYCELWRLVAEWRELQKKSGPFLHQMLFDGGLRIETPAAGGPTLAAVTLIGLDGGITLKVDVATFDEDRFRLHVEAVRQSLDCLQQMQAWVHRGHVWSRRVLYYVGTLSGLGAVIGGLWQWAHHHVQPSLSFGLVCGTLLAVLSPWLSRRLLSHLIRRQKLPPGLTDRW